MTTHELVSPSTTNNSRRITRIYGKKRTTYHAELPNSETNRQHFESAAASRLVKGPTLYVPKKTAKEVCVSRNKPNLEWNVIITDKAPSEKDEHASNKRPRSLTYQPHEKVVHKRRFDNTISVELLAKVDQSNTADYMIEVENNGQLLHRDVVLSVKSVSLFTTVQHFVDKKRLNERIVVLPNQLRKPDKTKVAHILNRVDSELGAANLLIDTDRHYYKIYLYLTATRKVVGCLVAEPINTAFRVVNPDNNDDTDLDDLLIYKSDTPVPCVCGISRIWVDKSRRRQGVASCLLDAVRKTFVYACTLDLEQIAFSQPTLLGRHLAMSYQQSTNFLVYTE